MRILRNHDFRLLWTSNAISGIGSWLLIVALPVQVFALTGSATATGLTLALEALPALVIGPWAGAVLDRWNLSRAMWLADLASAAAVASILLADRPGRVWIIYVAVLAENLATTVFRPAARALVPTVVGTGEDLAAANSLTAFSGSVIRLAAPPLGAILLAGPGIGFVLVVDAISYLLSAAIIATVSQRLTPRPETQEETHGAMHGLRYLRESKILRGILAGNGVFLTANAGLTALLVPLIVERLHAPGYAIGYLISGLGAGFLIGAAISMKASTWLSVRNLLIVTQVATAAAFFALVNARNVNQAVLAAVLIGIPGSVLLITAETTVQRVTPAGMLARIGALFYAVDSLSVILGALMAPALTTFIGLPLALNILATSALTAAPITFLAVPAHPAVLTRPRATEPR